MKLIDFYYHIKPAIPRFTQLFLRRVIAAQKRKSRTASWPIDPNATEKPSGWKGWPENKKFAFVLQHDVDTEKGFRGCTRLAEAEISFGFRSSFNFVPEDYFVPRELRQKLLDSGFEIGVHGLKHDGKTFKHEAIFQRSAPKINHYLREWGAVGFTSPSMLRNLSFMLDLDIEHGCSTFDTDPFEPQSDGFSTIFPFRVGGATDSKAYFELPYTLPQDHCLYIILREKDNCIWKKKLDWVAANGGMALLNSHPDYMNFDGTDCSREEYPIGLYKNFLEYARTKYAGQYWHALPREIAHFWKISTHENGANVNRKMASGLDLHMGEADRRCKNAKPYKVKIWIDLDNTPHVPFFIPIVKELERRGYQTVLTARDAFQVCEIAKAAGLPFTKVGHHYGRNPIKKILGLFKRSTQLLAFSKREKPDIALSHGARSQILLCKILNIPTIMIADYEHARMVPLTQPNWMIVPEAISPMSLPLKFYRIRQYPGIKEDIYVPNFTPDPSLLNELGISGDEIIVTVRPPADEAHYYSPESNVLFFELMSRVCHISGLRVILLPRNQRQEQTLRINHPEWFANSKSIVPSKAINGLNLLWYSDLVVSGGGTMNREAAALEVPVYSIFRGKTGAVDRMLEREGRLIMIRNQKEIWTNIIIVRRAKRLLPDNQPRAAFAKILYNIENIAEIEGQKARRRK